MNEMMNSTVLAVGAGLLLIALVVVAGVFSKRGRRLNVAYYEEKWKELQKLLNTTATWPLAIIDADKLLDQALKARRFKGKTMGERLVAAQREIKYNDEGLVISSVTSLFTKATSSSRSGMSKMHCWV